MAERTCMWPQDGHTPSLHQVESYTGCGLTPTRHRAISPDGAVVLLRLPVCDSCGDLAEAAGWTFEYLAPRHLEGDPLRLVVPDHLDPGTVGRALAAEVEAMLTDDRGRRPVSIRRASPEETAAFNEAYDQVKAVRDSLRPGPPSSVPRPRGLFPPGQEPRGCVAPLVAGVVLGTAVALSAAGMAWEAWHRRQGRHR